MNESRSTPDIDELADALLEATGQLCHIADHMVSAAEAGLSAPDAPPPSEVLRKLLAETLANARPGFAKVDVRRTAVVLRRTVRTIEREIYLVPADAPRENGSAGFDDA
ncbi:MAG TPA: hypothetical protein VFY99_02520 [Solirubrobacterales bacterium]